MYKFIHLGNVVIAITTYAGKTVKAYAKCHFDDKFDAEFGEKLAQARCNVKVAKKRMARAKKKHIEAVRIAAEAQAHENKMFNYMNDSADAVVVATKELEALLASTK